MGKEDGGGARSLPAMVGRKRSARLMEKMKRKELAEGNPEDEYLILKLNRELRDLSKIWKELHRNYSRYLGLYGEDVMPSEDDVEVKERRKKVVMDEVPQQVIENFRANPCSPSYGFPEHKLPERPQIYRELYEVQKAMNERILEHQKALINQFDTKGFAIDYSEVDDEEEKN